VDDVLIRFAACCHPLPGEDIIGYITQGRGVSIHSAACKHMSKVDPQRRIDVEWDIGQGEEEEVTYPVHIQVVCGERKGTLAELSGAIAEANANISYAHVETTPDQRGICDFTVHVTDKEHLRRVVQSLKRVKSVQKVTRVR